MSLSPLPQLLEALGRSLLSPFGVGMVAASLLACALRRLLSPEQRGLQRLPLRLVGLALTIHLLSVAIAEFSEPMVLMERIAELLLLASLARSFHLALFRSFAFRRFGFALPKILDDLLQGLLLFFVGLVVLQRAGVEPASLITTSALLTAIIGLSLQDTLGNLFAGLAIQAERPYEVGDWISFGPTPRDCGEVIEINWRATRLLTVERILVTVPNGVIAKSAFQNFSKPTKAVRRDDPFTVPFHVAPHEVQAALAGAFYQLPGVLTDPPPVVAHTGFGDQGHKYSLRYFIEDYSRREPISGALWARAWYALRRAGISVTPSQQVVHLVNDGLGAAPAAAPPLVPLLRQVDFLRPLSEEQREQLAAQAPLLFYGPGEELMHEGADGDRCFLLIQGTLEVWKQQQDGRSQRVGTVPSPGFVGEMSLLTGEPRTATVRAATACEVAVLSAELFHTVVEANAQVLEQISEIVAARQAELRESQRPDALIASPPASAAPELLARIRRFFGQ